MSARDEILAKLRGVEKRNIPQRSRQETGKAPLPGSDEVVEMFIRHFTAETGILSRVRDDAGVLERLRSIAAEEGLSSVMASTDGILSPLNLPEWGKRNRVRVMTARDFTRRDDFKDTVFDNTQAGITGADFAIAESGTLGLIIDRDMPRLVSLAPIIHIAVLARDRIYSTYEPVMKQVFRTGEYPSQFVFITGPSMTGDIRGELFRGIHGPRKVVVILVG